MIYMDDWVDFCMSRDELQGVWYDEHYGTSDNDYKVFISDFEKGVPRAIEFMLAYAKYKLTR